MTMPREVLMAPLHVLAAQGGAKAALAGKPLPGYTHNGGGCCSSACGAHLIDDVAFARALVSAVASLVPVDRSRVYSTGFSNGGFMSYRLGCQASDIFACATRTQNSFPLLMGCCLHVPLPTMLPTTTHGLLQCRGAGQRRACQPTESHNGIGPALRLCRGCADAAHPRDSGRAGDLHRQHLVRVAVSAGKRASVGRA